MGETSDKEKRTKKIQEEFDQIIAEADKFCLEHLEEDMDPEAVKALQKAANKVRSEDGSAYILYHLIAG